MAISVSSDFLSKLSKSHQIVTKVEILKGGAVQTLPTGVSFNLISGSVIEDRANSIRRTASFEIVDPSGLLTPTSLASLIAPNKNEIKPYRGIMTSSGAEYIPLGVFGFRQVTTIDDGENLTLQIQGFDRSEIIGRQRFTAPYAVASGTTIESAISTIIGTRYPGLTFISSVTGFTTPAVTFDVGADPWYSCTQLAESAGCEVFFDNLGRVVLQPEPDPSSATVNWTYTSGATATITSIERGFATAEYNHVIESGEGSGVIPPVTASSTDDNPYSPTWIGYGDFPLFHVSPLLTTTAQCQAAADARLRKILGATENVTFDSIVNPALAASDIIKITQPRVQVNQVAYVVDKVVTPMDAATGQSCTVRARTVGS